MQVFGTLKLLVVLLGSSWLLWGRSGPKKAPKIGPQMASNGQQEAQAQPAGALWEALVSKMAPRWLQDGSRWLKMAPSSPREPLGSLFGSSNAVLEGLGPPKTCKNQWFDVRFAFALPSLCFSIAFALPSLFLSNGGAPLSYFSFYLEYFPFI